VVYLVNLSEKDYIRQKNKNLPKIAEWVKEHASGDPILPLSVAFEERLTRFETDEEAAEECKKLCTKSALPKVVTTMRTMMDLGSFFTTGTDEVRQWTIRNGTKAPQAAGVIHGGRSISNIDVPIELRSMLTWTFPDFEKTFIQCIVYNYDALKEYGDEAELKAKGKIMTKGKDYVVIDGDVILRMFSNPTVRAKRLIFSQSKRELQNREIFWLLSKGAGRDVVLRSRHEKPHNEGSGSQWSGQSCKPSMYTSSLEFFDLKEDDARSGSEGFEPFPAAVIRACLCEHRHSDPLQKLLVGPCHACHSIVG